MRFCQRFPVPQLGRVDTHSSVQLRIRLATGHMLRGCLKGTEQWAAMAEAEYQVKRTQSIPCSRQVWTALRGCL